MTAVRVLMSGLGHMHPEHKIENKFFDDLEIGSSQAWVEEKTGILSRYSVLPEERLRQLRSEGAAGLQALRAAGQVPSLAAMAAQPWQMARERCQGAAAWQPDLVLSGTSVPDYDIPANASLIAQSLQLQGATFDVNSVCSSFVSGLTVAKSLIGQQVFRRIALFNCERYSLRLDYNDRKSAVLFGDGAACALLEEEQAGKQGLRLEDTVLYSDAAGCDLVTIPVGGHFSQQGPRVQRFAVTRTCEVTEAILKKNNVPLRELSYFVGHQANLRMLQHAAQKLGLSEAQHLYNVDHYGNQGAAGAPIVLSQNWHRLQKGDRIVVAVVGAGLTWGAALFVKV